MMDIKKKIKYYCFCGCYERFIKYLSEEDINLIYDFYKNKPKGYVVDHIHPISKGGMHHISNLRYISRKHNQEKYNKISVYITEKEELMDKNIKFKLKTVWGKERFHPENESAKLFCELVNRKNLSRDQLIICKKLGYEIYIPNMLVNKYLSDEYEV